MQLFPEIKFLLASKSPRRAELLSQAGISFTIIEQDVVENVPEDIDPIDAPRFLAELKSHSCISSLGHHDEVIIAADSLVLLDDSILTKPSDAKEAAQMLRLLSGKQHTVITGVSLLSMDNHSSFDETAIVKFCPLPEDAIHFYIKNYSPFDKAGSYGIQDWLGLCYIEYIHGNFSNVMGLPISRLLVELNCFLASK